MERIISFRESQKINPARRNKMSREITPIPDSKLNDLMLRPSYEQQYPELLIFSDENLGRLHYSNVVQEAPFEKTLLSSYTIRRDEDGTFHRFKEKQ